MGARWTGLPGSGRVEEQSHADKRKRDPEGSLFFAGLSADQMKSTLVRKRLIMVAASARVAVAVGATVEDDLPCTI